MYKSLFLVLLLISSCKTEGIKNDNQKDIKSDFSKKKSDFFHKSLKEDLNESDLKPTKIIDQKIISNQIKINYFKKGDGENVLENDVLKINYEVYLEDGTFIDGNKLLKKPWLPFLVGFEMQTPGWDIAFKTLKVGDFVEIYLPSKMARGEIGIKGLIPPNSSNIIRIKILEKLKPTKEIDGTKVWLLEENKQEKLFASLKNTVDFHYIVSTPSNPKYDISYQKNQPYSLKFSDFGIVKGLKKALINAKKSDKIWVLIPPSQAYGNRGLMNIIKPNEFVFYDLFVMDVR
jgi:FKBP-type peptidyl-prolyl cis-trans isomerase